ncbi:EscU/YscU/HrcU family type III secretion system export apparatus switch protein [Allosphingosinicella sp.]|jgi:flagellar biosynthetic protein FlhB|uniref:EscU/YscU/HrcU family type III secretion system export apparatus switch protein n=1 Tax=Allosphingosinicella sp. TaxID=2823234 RepID=UPI002EFEE02F
METEQDKSELATPYKLEQARRKGSIARGMDLAFFTVLAAFLAFAWIGGPALSRRLSQASGETLAMAPVALASPDELLGIAGSLFFSVMAPLAVLGAVVFLSVLALELVQTGIVFSATPLKPDFGRLNPAKGLKRIFSLRMLIETGKNVLKLAVYVAVAWFSIRQALGTEAAAVSDAATLTGSLSGAALRLIACFALTALAFVAIDQIIVRKDYRKKMRMSRREVRREVRDREGDGRLKQRRKQLHGEFVKASESLRGIRTADVVIANPTHVAVALRYDSATMVAPLVVSRGSDAFALRLKKLAFVYGVAVIEDRALARALLRTTELGSQVPEPFYRAVADIYLGLPPSRGRREVKR